MKCFCNDEWTDRIYEQALDFVLAMVNVEILIPQVNLKKKIWSFPQLKISNKILIVLESVGCIKYMLCTC